MAEEIANEELESSEIEGEELELDEPIDGEEGEEETPDDDSDEFEVPDLEEETEPKISRNARRRLKQKQEKETLVAERGEAQDELKRLRAENDALKGGKEPTFEDANYDEAEYKRLYKEYLSGNQQSEPKQAQQMGLTPAQERKLDDMYDEADNLKLSGKFESYQNAAIERLGEDLYTGIALTVDASDAAKLTCVLGGKNGSRKAERLLDIFEENPSRVGVEVGKLIAGIQPRKSGERPLPDEKPEGGRGKSGTGATAKLQKKLDEAYGENDMDKVKDIRKTAVEAGYSVNKGIIK